ncbi:hypothetical protein IGI04_022152 [Brassica rapa subsp. trilocularis]|uniref:RRM domain-containing protein n=1 Tax=Brassica rapa subsp. trilocularis TaxID=1813537 RepID=A0ABQ7M3N1_BRACM|nr:hypothetical protein IGI04_022152 [Brassica rapa subsp. trilocularis]
MASSSKTNSLGKRKPEDDLDTEPVLRRHKSEAKETNSDESALNSAKETIEGLDEDPDFVEEAAGPPNKKLFLDKLSSETEISDVIDFFKDVGQVVGVRLMLNHKGGRVDKRVGRRVENRLGLGFVEFASSDEAKKALKMKTGEYWSRNKVFLKVAATSLPPKYEDYLQREGLLIEEFAAVKGLDETPELPLEPAIPKKTLFVGRFSPQTKPTDIIDFFKDVGGVSYVRLIGDHTGKHVGYGFVDFASVNDANKALQQKNGEYLHDCKIFLELANNGLTYLPPNIDFFKDAGEVVRVRLILDQYGEHAGFGFVEFASSNEANKALQQKKGEYLHNHSIFLDVANNEFAENLPPKHCIDHKTLSVFDLLLTASVSMWAMALLNVGEVVHVRLICNLMGNHVGTGFVEFASADEAKKALEKKNGEHFHRRKIFLDVPKKAQGRFNSKIFKDVVQVVRVRLIVDHCGEHVSCGFVEFASANEAQKALRHRKRRCKLIFYEAEIAATYPFRHKYEDKLRREYLKTSPNLKIAFTDK